jgi:hypothetical protein
MFMVHVMLRMPVKWTCKVRVCQQRAQVCVYVSGWAQSLWTFVPLHVGHRGGSGRQVLVVRARAPEQVYRRIVWHFCGSSSEKCCEHIAGIGRILMHGSPSHVTGNVDSSVTCCAAL